RERDVSGVVDDGAERNLRRRDGGGGVAEEDGGGEGTGSLDRAADAARPFLEAVVGRAAVTGILGPTEDLIVQILAAELRVEVDVPGRVGAELGNRDVDEQVGPA